MRKYFIAFFVICSSLISVKASEDATIFITGVVDEALEIINKASMADEIKRKELSKCINKYLDVERMAQSVFNYLGYNRLTSDQKKKVQEYLRKYLLDFYASPGKLATMVNAEFLKNKTSTRKVSGNFQVTTKFTKSDPGNAATIVWVVRDNKIYYVEIEGANQVITLRSEMSEQIKSEDNLMPFIEKQLSAATS